MSEITLRSDGKYDTACPQCGEEVIVGRVHGGLGTGDLRTTDPEDHSAVCKGKKMLKNRQQWQTS